MLVEAARQLAEAGELPVNVRFAFDSEEEVGGQSIVEWVDADERGADAAIVFDGDMLRARRADLLHRAARALLLPRHGAHRASATSTRALFGGAALNAMHALMQTLSRRPPARRPRSRAAPRRDRAADAGGARELEDADAGRRAARRGAAPQPADDKAGGGVLHPHLGRARRRRARPRRRLARPREDGAPGRGAGERLDPASRRARTSDEIARGVRAAPARGRARGRRGRGRAPVARASPRWFRRTRPRIDARARGVRAGARPRVDCSSASAGSIPVAESIVAQGIPAIVTGIATTDANAHSPNEKFPSDVPRRSASTPSERRTAGSVSSGEPGSVRRTRRLREPARRGARRRRARAVPPLRPDRHAGRVPRGAAAEHGEAARPLAPPARGAARARARGRRADRGLRRLRRACPASRARRSSASSRTSTRRPTSRAPASRRSCTRRGTEGRSSSRATSARCSTRTLLPELAARVGHDIVTSDGTTLLGADDKAGIAEIMTAVAYLVRHPERPRAPIRVAFTVDEEVGRGAEDFDLDALRRRRRVHARRLRARRARDRDLLGEVDPGHHPRPLGASRGARRASS